MPSEEKDPRKSIHIDDVAAARAGARRGVRRGDGVSSINFNTVWTSIFEPLPTFGFLKRLGKESVWGARHDQPYHVIGQRRRRASCCGSARRCATGSRATRVTVHCNYVDDQDPSAHDDSMLAANQRIWGFESNFGGLAEIAS